MKSISAFVFICALALATAQLGPIIPVGYSTPTASFSLGVPYAYAYAPAASSNYVQYVPAPVAVAAVPAAVGYTLLKK